MRLFHGEAGVGRGDGWTVKDEERDIQRGRDIKRTVLFLALSLLQSLLGRARATVECMCAFMLCGTHLEG